MAPWHGTRITVTIVSSSFDEEARVHQLENNFVICNLNRRIQPPPDRYYYAIDDGGKGAL